MLEVSVLRTPLDRQTEVDEDMVEDTVMLLPMVNVSSPAEKWFLISE